MRRSERVDPATKERLLQRRLKAEAEKKALAKSLALALDDDDDEEEEEEDEKNVSSGKKSSLRSSSKSRKRQRHDGNDKNNIENDDDDDVLVEEDNVCGPRRFKWLGESLRETEDGTRYYSSFILGGVVFRLGDWISVASTSSSDKRKSGASSSDSNKKKKSRRSSNLSLVSGRRSSSSSSSSSSFCPGRIESIWSLKDGTKMCALSWCYLPNETSIGKKLVSTGDSEVFISTHAEGVEIAAIDRRARILSIQQWKTRTKDAAEMRKKNDLKRRLLIANNSTALNGRSRAGSVTMATTTTTTKAANDGSAAISSIVPPKSPSPGRRSGRLTPSMPTPTLGMSATTSASRSKAGRSGGKVESKKGDKKDGGKDDEEGEEEIDEEEDVTSEDVLSEDEGDDGDALFQVDHGVLIAQRKDDDEEENEEGEEDQKEEDLVESVQGLNDYDDINDEEEEDEKKLSSRGLAVKTTKMEKKRSGTLFSKFLKSEKKKKKEVDVVDRSPLRFALYWTRYFYDFGTKQVRALNQHELESLINASDTSSANNGSSSSRSSIMSRIGPSATSSMAADIALVFPLAIRGHAITQQQGGLGRSGPLPGLGIGLGVTSGTGAFTGAHTSSLAVASAASAFDLQGGGDIVSLSQGRGEQGSHIAPINRGGGGGNAGFGGALTGGDIFKRASRQLALSAAPPSMPCRESERKQLLDTLDAAIRRGGLGQALYVSGMPGMGKTATMTEVVRELQSRNASGDLPDFNYVEVNAMKLSSPPALYTVLHRALTGVVLPPARACSALDTRFSASSSSTSSSSSLKKKKSKKTDEELTTLLLVDELDFCVTRKQQVLYNLFEWPTRPGAKLIVVGIANVQDMPERLLPKVASRLGLGRITFSAYTAKQIEMIVTARLQGIPAFSAEAVTMCAKKVCNSTGDVRRALHMCRRAVEIAKARVEAAEAAGLLPKGSSVGLVHPKSSLIASSTATKQQQQQPSSSMKGVADGVLGVYSGSINPPTSPMIMMPPNSLSSSSSTTMTMSTKASHFATPVAPPPPPPPSSQPISSTSAAVAAAALSEAVRVAPPPPTQVFSPASLNNPLAVRVTLDDLKAAASEISASVAQRAIGQTAPFERFLLVMLAEAVRRSNNNAAPRHLGELLIRGKELVKLHCRTAFEMAKAKEAAIVASASNAAASAAAALSKPSTSPIIPSSQANAALLSSASLSLQAKTPAAVNHASSSSSYGGGAINAAITSPTMITSPGNVAQRLSLSHVKSAPPHPIPSMATNATTSPASVAPLPSIASISKATPLPTRPSLQVTTTPSTSASAVFVPNNRWEAAQRSWNDDHTTTTSSSSFRSGPRMISITAYNPFPTAHDLLACAMRLDALKLIVCEWPRPVAEPLASAMWDGQSYEDARYKFGGGENERTILPPDMPFVSFGCIQPDDILLVLNEDPLVKVLRESGVL